MDTIKLWVEAGFRINDTSRGSRQFVLIEVGSRLHAVSRIQAWGNHVLLTMETHQQQVHHLDVAVFENGF